MFSFLDWALGPVDEAILGFLGGAIALVLTLFIVGLIFAAMIGQGGRFFGWSVRSAALLGWVLCKPLFSGVKRGAELAAFHAVDTPARRGRIKDPGEALIQKEERNPCGGGASPGEKIEHGAWPVLGKVYEAVHVLVVGMPGSGKGQTLLLPALRSLLRGTKENVVFCTPKAKDKELVKSYLTEEDRVFSFSFVKQDDDSDAINPLYDEEAAANAAEFLIPAEDGQGRYWDEGGQSIFTSVWKALREELSVKAPNPVQVYDAIADPERLNDLKERYACIRAVGLNEKEFESFRSTAEKALRQLAYERVRRVFSATDETELPDFSGGSGKNVVFATLDSTAGERLKKYVGLLMEYLHGQASAEGYAGGPGTRILIDEAGSFMRLTELPKYINLAREYRVQMLYVLQNFTQLESQLGRNKAKDCFSSTEMKVVGASDDRETAEIVSELSGQEHPRHKGPRQRDWHKRVVEERRPRLYRDEVYKLEKGEWVILKTPLVERVKVSEKFYFYRQTAGEHGDGPGPGRPNGGNNGGPGGMPEPDQGEQPDATDPKHGPDSPEAEAPEPGESESDAGKGAERHGESAEGPESEGGGGEPESDSRGSENTGYSTPETDRKPDAGAPSVRERLKDLDGYKEPPKSGENGSAHSKDGQGNAEESEERTPQIEPTPEPELPPEEPMSEPPLEPHEESGGEKVECWNCEQPNPADASICELCEVKWPGAGSDDGNRDEGRGASSRDRDG